MRHQPFHPYHPFLHQPYGPRPRITIPVLKLQVDFLRAEPHKRDAHIRFADADDEDFAPEFDTVDGRGDGCFDARAFERDARFAVAEGGDDGGGAVGGREGRVDFVGFCARAEFGGVGETVGVDVCDDDGAGAGCLAAKESDETDGSCAADEDAVAEFDAAAFHAGEGDAEGFE